MKPLLFLLLLSVTLASAATRTLEWDPNPPEDFVVRYDLWEKLGPGWAKIGEASATEITISVSPGSHTYAVTAVNAAGLESLRSNELTFTEPVEPPGNLRLRVAAVQASVDLKQWQTVAFVNLPELGDRTFYQLNFTPP